MYGEEEEKHPMQVAFEKMHEKMEDDAAVVSELHPALIAAAEAIAKGGSGRAEIATAYAELLSRRMQMSGIWAQELDSQIMTLVNIASLAKE